MRTKSLAVCLSAEEMLADFEKQVTSRFRFLETTFDLPLLTSERDGTEFAVRYGTATERVFIQIEPYCLPWIVLQRRQGPGWKSVGLHRLYKKHFGETMPGYPKRTKIEIYDTSNLQTLGDILVKNLRLFLSLV